jgi:hypothetical protein
VGGERATAPHFGGIFYWIAFTSSGTPDNRPLSGRSRKFSVKYRNDAGFYKELSASRTLFFGKGPGGGLQGIDRLVIFAVQLTLAGLRRGFCLKSDAAAPIDHPIRCAGIKRAARPLKQHR